MKQEDLNKGLRDVLKRCEYCGEALTFRNCIAYCNNENCKGEKTDEKIRNSTKPTN